MGLIATAIIGMVAVGIGFASIYGLMGLFQKDRDKE